MKGRVVYYLESFVIFIIAILGCLFMTITSLIAIVRKGPGAFFKVNRREAPPKCVLDAALGDHGFVVLKSGIKIHYVANGDRKNPLMLMLHGYPEFWYSWRHQLKHFCDKYYVVAVDNRGYGQSSKPKGVEEYTLNKLGEDVKQTVDALGYKSCILVGHDWGGAVAWHVASRYPQVVDKLIALNGPHPGGYRRFVRTHFSQVIKSWYIAFYQIPFLPEYFARCADYGVIDVCLRGKQAGVRNRDRITKEDIEAFKQNFDEPGSLTCAINYYRASARTRPAGKYEPIRAPTLVIWGLDDVALDPAMIIEFAKDTPNMVTRYIPNASHWVQQDEPDLCNRYMREFLK